MFSTVIVVDEEKTRNELRTVFPWRIYQYEVVDEVGNIFEAMRVIQKTQPELVTLALQHSEKEGLALTSWIREKYPQIVVVVVSTRKNFAYLRETIQLGVVDYIIATKVDRSAADIFLARVTRLIKNNFKERVRQAELSSSLEKYREIAIAGFWREVFNRTADDRETLLRAKLLGIDTCNVKFGLLIVHTTRNQAALNSETVIDIRRIFDNMLKLSWHTDQSWWLVDFRNNYWILVGSTYRKETAIMQQLHEYAQILTEIGQGSITVSITDQCCLFNQIPHFFQETMETNLLRLYNGGGRLIRSEELAAVRNTGSVRLYEVIGSWEAALRIGDWKTLEPLIVNLFNETVPRLAPHQGQRLVLDLVNVLQRVALERQIPWEAIEAGDEEPQQRIERVASLGDWLDWITNLVSRYLETVEQADASPLALIMQKAQQFIHHNFARDLSLKEVADFVGVSDSYFSRVFSKTLGENFNHYLRRLRIERAKEFLRLSDRRIHEIANEVGFGSVRYFSRVFYNVEGQTPANYRQTFAEELVDSIN